MSANAAMLKARFRCGGGVSDAGAGGQPAAPRGGRAQPGPAEAPARSRDHGGAELSRRRIRWPRPSFADAWLSGVVVALTAALYLAAAVTDALWLRIPKRLGPGAAGAFYAMVAAAALAQGRIGWGALALTHGLPGLAAFVFGRRAVCLGQAGRRRREAAGGHLPVGRHRAGAGAAEWCWGSRA